MCILERFGRHLRYDRLPFFTQSQIPNTLLINNTIFNNSSQAAAFVGGGVNGRGTEDQMWLYNNIIFNNPNGTGNSTNRFNGLQEARNNLIDATLVASITDGTDGNKVGMAYNPGFSGGGDFTLQAGSDAINMGNNADVFGNLDVAGLLRIAEGTVEIGAHEFNSMPPVVASAPIPTMSQWALLLFGLLVFTLGLVVVWNVQRVMPAKSL